jgi:hypothetical protein
MDLWIRGLDRLYRSKSASGSGGRVARGTGHGTSLFS